jgi:pyridoxamine 5'-phosphate oxidase family protein
VPVSFAYNGSLDTIDIGGHALADTKKWRDIGRDPRVAFVVDDLLPPWRPRIVEIRGRASRLSAGGSLLGPGFADELIRITPTRIVSFGLDGTRDLNARNVGSVADQP